MQMKPISDPMPPTPQHAPSPVEVVVITATPSLSKVAITGGKHSILPAATAAVKNSHAKVASQARAKIGYSVKFSSVNVTEKSVPSGTSIDSISAETQGWVSQS